MMHQKELLLSESVAEQCAECMGHSSWKAEIGLSQRASWLLGLSKLITNSLISSPVCAFLHLSYNLVKVLGLLLPSESSAWLLSRKQCRARFHRGCSGVCVYVLCQLWAFLVCHRKWPLAWSVQHSSKAHSADAENPLCLCCDVCNHLNESCSSQIRWKTLNTPQNNCWHFTKPQLPLVLEQGGMCDTEWECQEQRACLLNCSKRYYSAWNIYHWGLDCRDVKGGKSITMGQGEVRKRVKYQSRKKGNHRDKSQVKAQRNRK